MPQNHSGTGSLAPSDSVSCSNANKHIHQPATHPSNLPVEILWHFEDCRQDPNISMTPANWLHQNMERAIHNLDGTMISWGDGLPFKILPITFKWSSLVSLPPKEWNHARKQRHIFGLTMQRIGIMLLKGSKSNSHFSNTVQDIGKWSSSLPVFCCKKKQNLQAESSDSNDNDDDLNPSGPNK